jgi:hypothetical protein|tara:strand:+ start:23 stop:364 length:342 start_codon:yes stop_codon:yes gene_type:complete
MCFFGGGGGGAPGPQSSADKATGGYVPPTSGQGGNAGNPHSDAATPQGQRSATQSQQTADRNTMRRADSYGSQQTASSASVKKSNATAVQGGMKTMNALNDYNKANKKTILGS